MDLPDGFVAHDGGPCPVPLNAKVEVLFRGGEIRYSRPSVWWTAFNGTFAEHDLWQHQSPDHDNDIIAYRPQENPNASN